MQIEDGKYKGKAKTSIPTLIESSKGTPGIAVDMVFTDPEMHAETLGWTGWLSDGAFDRTIESLRIMGWEGDDLEAVSGLDKNEVELVVAGEEYEGNIYPRIKFINRIGVAMGVPMTADKKKSFAAAMKSRIQALDAAGGRKRSAPKGRHEGALPPEPPPHDDIDIPF